MVSERRGGVAMPRKSDSLAINNRKYDRRIKLTDKEREKIRKEYQEGDTSYNRLAKKYGVSKRLIQFIVNPEKAEIAKKQYSERRRDGRYYDKEKHSEAVKNHRNHKKKLFEEGIINYEKRDR
jgi:transposase-like protein